TLSKAGPNSTKASLTKVNALCGANTFSASNRLGFVALAASLVIWILLAEVKARCGAKTRTHRAAKQVTGTSTGARPWTDDRPERISMQRLRLLSRRRPRTPARHTQCRPRGYRRRFSAHFPPLRCANRERLASARRRARPADSGSGYGPPKDDCAAC